MRSRLLSERFTEALAYAAELHAGHRRKGPGDLPYMGHLLAVASLVLEDGGSEQEAIAALLHDAIEDQPRDGGTRTEIGDRFGPAVLAIVECCTDADSHPKPPWAERKNEYLRHLREDDLPEGVLRVVAADKLHNARSLLSDYRAVGDQLWIRFNAGSAEGQLWYYGAVADVLVERGAGPLAAELRETVDELVRLVEAEQSVSPEG